MLGMEMVTLQIPEAERQTLVDTWLQETQSPS